MSARESGVAGDAACTVNQEGDRGPISQQLKEVIELASLTNQRLEDCAVEWQAKISQAQWRILDARPVENKPWEQSVLARTYFADKKLDDAFQGLLKHNVTFTDHLQNFVALVRGEQPTMTTRQTSNAQNQCTELSPGDEEQLSPCCSLPPPLDLFALEESPNPRKGKRNSDNFLARTQQSFTDLIKAKIDFDTKFLGFEAALNGNDCAGSDPSLSLCQICSRVLDCGKGTACKSTRNVQLHKKKNRYSTRIKHKRLTSKKNVLKSKEKKLSKKSIKESAPDNCCLSNQSGITAGSV